jgi:hypothetical protein
LRNLSEYSPVRKLHRKSSNFFEHCRFGAAEVVELGIPALVSAIALGAWRSGGC